MELNSSWRISFFLSKMSDKRRREAVFSLLMFLLRSVWQVDVPAVFADKVMKAAMKHIEIITKAQAKGANAFQRRSCQRAHLLPSGLNQVSIIWLTLSLFLVVQWRLGRVWSRRLWRSTAAASTSLCTAGKTSCSIWGRWHRCCFPTSYLPKPPTVGTLPAASLDGSSKQSNTDFVEF